MAHAHLGRRDGRRLELGCLRTINGKTRVWRQGTTDGSPGALKKTEGECSTMLQLAPVEPCGRRGQGEQGADRACGDWSRLDRGPSTSAGHIDETSHERSRPNRSRRDEETCVVVGCPV